MTDLEQLPPPAPAPTFLGQGTAIEQSRAVAEVQAAVIIAKQFPRNVPAATAAMRDACRQPTLAAKAFYRYPRSGETVTGPSIHLARELARCWGNVQYGISELRRDDPGGYSEMQAVAWDLETNTRAAAIFVVPHRRDTKDGIVDLPDLRSVYESNANQGARRVREQIFSVLPRWLRKEAEDRCRATLEDGGGKSLAQRTADAVAMFEDAGVTTAMLETKVGRPAGQWTAFDIAQLGITYRSLRNGEVTVEQEFTSTRVTAADILGASIPVPKHEPGGEDIPAGVTPLDVDLWQVDLAQAHDAGDGKLIEALAANAEAAGRPDLARQARAAR